MENVQRSPSRRLNMSISRGNSITEMLSSRRRASLQVDSRPGPAKLKPHDEVALVFASTRVWFALCNMNQQQDVLFMTTRAMDEHTQQQILLLLQPMTGKDITYSFSLQHQKAQVLQQTGTADTLRQPDLDRGFFGARVLVSPSYPSGSTSLDALTKQRRGPSSLIAQKRSRQTIHHGFNDLLSWMATADSLRQLLLFKELIPYCALVALYALHISLSSTDFHRFTKPIRSRAKSFDLILMLPLHISKQILMNLDYREIDRAKDVSNAWKSIIEEVEKDKNHRQEANDFVLDLKAVCDPAYSAWVDIDVFDEHGNPAKERVFERNIFCGASRVITFGDKISQGDKINRDHCAHFASGNLVITGSMDKVARLWNARTGQITRSLRGHAASVHCVFLDEENDFVLTGSYDTSIRRWSISTGQCECIYSGHHKATILCVDANHDCNVVISGSKDRTLNVWYLNNDASVTAPSRRPHHTSSSSATKSRFRKSFKVGAIVQCAKLYCPDGKNGRQHAFAGTQAGIAIYVDVIKCEVLKTIRAHSGPINCVSLDNNILASGGNDGFVFLQSTAIHKDEPDPKFLRHTTEVLCLQILSQRVVTGAKDGKLRIWTMQPVECISIFRGDSYCNPIIGLSFRNHSSICVNTSTRLNVLHFDTETEQVDKSNVKPVEQPQLSSMLQSLISPPRIRSKSPRRSLAPVHVFSGQWRSELKRELIRKPSSNLLQLQPLPVVSSSSQHQHQHSPHHQHHHHHHKPQQQHQQRRQQQQQQQQFFCNSQVWGIDDGYVPLSKSLRHTKSTGHIF